MKLWQWIKIFFSNVFEKLAPFIARFIAAEAKGLAPLVLDAIIAIAALPNYNSMTWAEKLGAAVAQIQAKAIEISKEFTKTEIINAIQVQITALDSK